MIVDAHVHVWPDKIAPKVAERLLNVAGKLFTECSLQSLLEHMQRCGVDRSIVFGVAERPDTVQRTNDWLLGIDDPRVKALGSVHPDFSEPAAELARLRSGGIKGVKFHSLFQPCIPDDRKMFPIYDAMADDMIAFFHVGGGFNTPPEAALSTPARIARVRSAFPRLRIVAAHFGGLVMLDEAKEHLIGQDVFVDTSWGPSLSALPANEVVGIIRRHGVENVLFGTDSPLANQAEEIEAVHRLGLTDREAELVLGGNAMRLFDLS